ncbi:MAG: DUF3467 domain-containing protein [Tepidisphaeraceae bacterium]
MSNPNDPASPFASGPLPERPQGHFSARVPERVARGVYCTAQVIQDSPKEFVLDFMQGLNRPYQVAARVVITPATMGEFIAAYEKNLDGYTKSFGPPPPVNTPPQERRPSIEEIYENYKLSDDMQSGAYANTVLMGHSQTEFFFDFITGFYPTPSVAARVILPSAQAPRFLTTLKNSLQQYYVRYGKKPDAHGEAPSGEPPSEQPPEPRSGQ